MLNTLNKIRFNRILALFVLLACTLSESKAQCSTTTNKDPIQCAECLIGSPYNSDAVIGLLSSEIYDWELDYYNEVSVGDSIYDAAYWECISEGMFFRMGSAPIRQKTDVKMAVSLISIRANNSYFKRDYFDSWLEKLGLSNNFKDNEKKLRSNRQFISCVKEDGDVILEYTHQNGCEVRIEWSKNQKNYRTENRKHFVKEIRWKWNKDEVREACDELNNFVGSLAVYRAGFNVNDYSTYWKLLGVELSPADVVRFQVELGLRHGVDKYKDYYAHDYIQTKGKGVRLYLKDPDKEGIRKIREVRYHPGISESRLPEPLGRVTTRGQIEAVYGLSHENEKYRYRLIGEDEYDSSKTSIVARFEFIDGFSLSKIIIETEQGDSFDHILDKNWSDIFRAGKCVYGDCDDSTGIYKYPDGYQFVGNFKDGKPNYGFIYDRKNEKTKFGTWPEKKKVEKPRTIYDKRKLLYSQMDGLEKQPNRLTDIYLRYMRSTERSYGTSGQASIDNFGEARKALADLDAECIQVKRKVNAAINSAAEDNYCSEVQSPLRAVLTHVDEIQRINKGIMTGSFNKKSFEEWESYINPLSAKLKTAIVDMGSDVVTAMQAFNDCPER